VLRRLVECLSRDRTKHQVAEVTSLGLVQMTRKKLGLGLLETFSEPCEICAGRGVVIHHEPVNRRHVPQSQGQSEPGTGRRSRGGKGGNGSSNNNNNNQQQQAPRSAPVNGGTHAITDDVRNALARVAASTVHADHEAHAAEVAPHEDPTLPDVRVEILDVPTADLPAAVDLPVALDLPAPKKERAPRRSRPAGADDLLGSVLEALPEPKQPGQGRSRVSRRAGSAGAVVSAPISED
jgi:ribonuclease E